METKVEYEVQSKGIDLSALARDMLRWEQVKRQLDEMEAAIKDTVLQLGKTQTVGNVRATFSNPRNGYDYETPVRRLLSSDDLSEDDKIQLWALVGDNTRQVVEWRAVCKGTGIEPIVTPGTGPGSVSIKLLS